MAETAASTTASAAAAVAMVAAVTASAAAAAALLSRGRNEKDDARRIGVPCDGLAGKLPDGAPLLLATDFEPRPPAMLPTAPFAVESTAAAALLVEVFQTKE